MTLLTDESRISDATSGESVMVRRRMSWRQNSEKDLSFGYAAAKLLWMWFCSRLEINMSAVEAPPPRNNHVNHLLLLYTSNISDLSVEVMLLG